MAGWNIKPEYFLIMAAVSFLVSIIIFLKPVLEDDATGNLIFGCVWLILGVVWIGQYLHLKKKN